MKKFLLIILSSVFLILACSDEENESSKLQTTNETQNEVVFKLKVFDENGKILPTADYDAHLERLQDSEDFGPVKEWPFELIFKLVAESNKNYYFIVKKSGYYDWVGSLCTYTYDELTSVDEVSVRVKLIPTNSPGEPPSSCSDEEEYTRTTLHFDYL
jgi:hypothetical protein